jgi:uncharacterized hydrophobic protein (TIGR00271 family)
MCVAPFLGPSRAVCIGGLFRNRKIFLRGLVKQLFGLLIVGSGIAYAITTLLRVSVPEIVITSEILLRAMPAMRDVLLSIIVAVAAGAGASLALDADPKVAETPWGQIVDVVVGVEISVSLIPPAAVAGIGLAFGEPDITYNALLLTLVNVLGLDLFGSMFMLALRGIRLRYLQKEKLIRHTVESALVAVPSISFVGFAINVTLLDDNVATVHAKVQNKSSETVPENLAQSIVAQLQEKIGYRCEVTLEFIPTQTSSIL